MKMNVYKDKEHIQYLFLLNNSDSDHGLSKNSFGNGVQCEDSKLIRYLSAKQRDMVNFKSLDNFGALAIVSSFLSLPICNGNFFDQFVCFKYSPRAYSHSGMSDVYELNMRARSKSDLALSHVRMYGIVSSVITCGQRLRSVFINKSLPRFAEANLGLKYEKKKKLYKKVLRI